MNSAGPENPNDAPTMAAEPPAAASNGAGAPSDGQPAGEAKPPEKTVQEVLGSVHTTNFPGPPAPSSSGCLVVSTYQAGKLVILRPDGNSINTHFRSFNRPMGMAADASG